MVSEPKQPYSDDMLKALLKAADGHDEQIEVIRSHIQRGGQVRASIALECTACATIEDVRGMLLEATGHKRPDGAES